MAQTTVRDLTAATTPLSGDELLYLDVGAGVAGRKITVANLLKSYFRLGDTVISCTAGLGATEGLLSYGCAKVATTGTYADLYAVVGDKFETARTAAGWAASGAGYFYPSPPAGYFPRPAYPDFEFDYTDINVDDTIDYTAHPFRTGTPVLYIEGTSGITGLTDGTVYYIIDSDANNIKLASTEANAVAGTAVDITAVGTGTGHKLRHAYNLEEDAFQGWQAGSSEDSTGARDTWISAQARDFRPDASSASNYTKTEQNTTFQGDSNMVKAMNDGTNGTPRTTNETRPAQIALYFYIRALYLL